MLRVTSSVAYTVYLMTTIVYLMTLVSLASQTIPQPTVIWVDGGEGLGFRVHPNDCRLGNGLACETRHWLGCKPRNLC